jgi:hypothetical protein
MRYVNIQTERWGVVGPVGVSRYVGLPKKSRVSLIPPIVTSLAAMEDTNELLEKTRKFQASLRATNHHAGEGHKTGRTNQPHKEGECDEVEELSALDYQQSRRVTRAHSASDGGEWWIWYTSPRDDRPMPHEGDPSSSIHTRPHP